MHRKGMTGTVMLVIGALLAIILVANVLAPVVDQSRAAQSTTESLARTTAPNFENDTLSKAASYTLETGGLTITGLTLTTNYTVDYTTGVVTFNNVTANGTYSATYGYYEASYLTNATHRTVMGLTILACLLGIVALIFKGFGLWD